MKNKYICSISTQALIQHPNESPDTRVAPLNLAPRGFSVASARALHPQRCLCLSFITSLLRTINTNRAPAH